MPKLISQCICLLITFLCTSLVAQMVKHLLTMRETRVRFLGWEDPLEKEMATHSSALAWKIPWMEERGGYSPWDRKESDTTEQPHFTFLCWRYHCLSTRFCFYFPIGIPCLGLPRGSVVKNPPAITGDVGSIPGLGRSPWEGNGNPLQYSCLGNPKDRGAWRATVHGWHHKRVAPDWATNRQSMT